ncbi:MAG: glycosyltransferase family 4 protein [Sedimentisphaerales bacterium]|nr:glycosyltransferase family 4 protein [Sedimentisphaerales bacterium]
MKVALFSRYPNDYQQPKGGIESVTVVLARALSQLTDIEVHLITLERCRSEVAIEHDGEVTIHRLIGSNWPEIMDILAGPGKKRLLNYISDLKPDVLHTHETYGLCLGNISIPHVFTVHGFDHANLIANSAKHAWIRSPLWKYVEKYGFSKQKHIISISPYVRKMIEPLTNAKIYDIDNPVDERFFNIERKPEQGRILCVGWVNERKNTLGSVEAFAGIAGLFPQSKLIIAGQANEEEYLNRIKQSIKKHNIDNQVAILGHVNHIQLKEELSRASILLLPSRQENAPMAIAEAMAAAIPVIVSNLCGMPYMVAEGQSGFLVDPESNEQISNRLNQLVASEQLCKQMGEKGRQIALERFHPQSVAQKTKVVYEQIYAEKR